MSDTIIKAENISKLYKLGMAGSGSLYQSLGMGLKSLLKGRTNSASQKDFWALKDINFEIKEGEVVGIVGRNGAGKSTLLKVMSRITKPSTGRIELNGRIASLLEVGTGFHPELTGRENIFLNGSILGMSRAEIRQKFDEIVDFSGISEFLDTPVKRYSSGMYVRLAFAVAAHLESEILVIDEVLAVGDMEFQKKCLGKMNNVAKSGRTVLFVSHNMGAVKTLCNKGFYLKNGTVLMQGDIDDVVDLYLEQSRVSEKIYESGAVSKILTYQDGANIILELDYNCEQELKLPNLGFVLNDRDGNPIMGLNPMMQPNLTEKNGFYPKKGKVRVNISSPKLLDGIYSFSIWFGDKSGNFFWENDCVSIEIIAMTDIIQMYRPAQVGYVVPDCNFEFS
jgi:lipopolysaccharide transport system ATP-binding protein